MNIKIKQKQTRICYICKKELPLIHKYFYKDSTQPFKLSYRCRECSRKVAKEYSKKRRERQQKRKKENIHKIDHEIYTGKLVRCKGYRKITSQDPHFIKAIKKNISRVNRNIGGLNEMCKECTRKYKIEVEYNISYKIYEKKYKKQQGRCIICGTFQKILHIDHNHKNNNFRGLVCNNCNSGLGHFRDNSLILFKAIKYLENNFFNIKNKKIIKI